LTVFGADACAKARRAGEAVLARLAASGVSLCESLVECLGAGACSPRGIDHQTEKQLTEVVLRVAAADGSREALERFARELMPLVTAGPPGTTGYAAGRPRIHPLFRFWPCLIAREQVQPHVELFAADTERGAGGREQVAGALAVTSAPAAIRSSLLAPCSPLPAPSPSPPRTLGDLAHARSGDKGIDANIGVIARRPDDFARLCREATVGRVAAHLGIDDTRRVVRYEVPNLAAVNFVIHGILANSLRCDAQGKALGQVLLQMPLNEP
jgi:hypothetical protein